MLQIFFDHVTTLHKISVHNLLPTGGYYEEVTNIDLFVLFHLLRMQPISLPFIILNHIMNIIEPSFGTQNLIQMELELYQADKIQAHKN